MTSPRVRVAEEVAGAIAPRGAGGISSWLRRQVIKVGVASGLLTAGVVAIIHQGNQPSEQQIRANQTATEQEAAIARALAERQRNEQRDHQLAILRAKQNRDEPLSREEIALLESQRAADREPLPATAVAHNHRLGISLSVVDSGNAIQITSRTPITALGIRPTMGTHLNQATPIDDPAIVYSADRKTVTIPVSLLGTPRAAQIVVTNQVDASTTNVQTGGINLARNGITMPRATPG